MRRRSLLLLPVFLVAGCGGSGVSTAGPSVCSTSLYTPNYGSTSGLTLRRWNHLPITVYFETNTPVGSTTIEQHLRDGFNQWETDLGHDLWTEVTSPTGADMTVKVQATSAQSTLASTTVYFTGGSQILTSAQMTVYTWDSLPESDYAPTGCHEMGHALGIGGHSPNSQDMMYYTGNTSGILTTPDLNTLRTCYCDFASASIARPKAKTSEPILSETEYYPHR